MYVKCFENLTCPAYTLCYSLHVLVLLIKLLCSFLLSFPFYLQNCIYLTMEGFAYLHVYI